MITEKDLNLIERLIEASNDEAEILILQQMMWRSEIFDDSDRDFLKIKEERYFGYGYDKRSDT